MPKSKPASPPEVKIALDLIPGLSKKSLGILKEALAPPYSQEEWTRLRRAVFVPVDAKGVIKLICEFLEDRARDPKHKKAARELYRKAAKIVNRDEDDMDGERKSLTKQEPSPIMKKKLRPAFAATKMGKTKMPVRGNLRFGRR